MSYWLIKTLLVLALVAVTVILLRPVKTDSTLALRRIGMLLVLLAAAFAIIFPEVFNKFARSIGVESGLNLIVYLLVVAIFAQMATSYRREATNEVKLTKMARELALIQAEQNKGDQNSPTGPPDGAAENFQNSTNGERKASATPPKPTETDGKHDES